MKLTTVGIDLAKNVFQAHGIDEHGKVAKYAHPLEKVKRADFPSEGSSQKTTRTSPRLQTASILSRLRSNGLRYLFSGFSDQISNIRSVGAGC